MINNNGKGSNGAQMACRRRMGPEIRPAHREAEQKKEAYNGNSNYGGSPFGDCGIGRKKNDTGQKERKVSPVRLRLRKVRGLRA